MPTKYSKFKKALRILTFSLVGIYVISATTLYFYQDKLIFKGWKLDKDFQCQIGTEIKISGEDGNQLSCLYVNQKNPKGIIIYFHGNRGNLKRCTYQAQQFLVPNYDLIMPDYRGYGNSEGEIESQDQLFNDAQAIYDYVKNKFDEKDITLVGYSLGTGVVSYLAEHNNPSALYLVAPYKSLIDVKDDLGIPVPDFLVKFPLETYKRIKNINCPIYIFHCPSDQLLPYDSSYEMYQQNKERIKFFTLNGDSHASTIFNNKIKQIISANLN